VSNFCTCKNSRTDPVNGRCRGCGKLPMPTDSQRDLRSVPVSTAPRHSPSATFRNAPLRVAHVVDVDFRMQADRADERQQYAHLPEPPGLPDGPQFDPFNTRDEPEPDKEMRAEPSVMFGNPTHKWRCPNAECQAIIVWLQDEPKPEKCYFCSTPVFVPLEMH
jgi:hypothetical protein